MRKKCFLVAGILVASMALAACGSNNNNQNTAGSAATQQQEQEAGYIFTAKSQSMQVEGDLAAYVAALGQPAGGTYEAKSCAFDGMDKFYYYDGFTLQGFQRNGKDLVYAITLNDDSVKTAEGIRIGDTKEKMETVYGNATSAGTAGQYIYAKGRMSLKFVVKEDVIQSIEYVLNM